MKGSWGKSLSLCFHTGRAIGLKLNVQDGRQQLGDTADCQRQATASLTVTRWLGHKPKREQNGSWEYLFVLHLIARDIPSRKD